MALVNKIKGILLVILGITWISFIYNFDALTGKPRALGIKAILGFIIGIIVVINGMRIYRRNNAK